MEYRDKCAQNQGSPEHFSAYVVIPSSVFFDSGITPRAKLLYGLISSMCNHKGFCWAKNSTISKYLTATDGKTVTDEKTVSESTVRRLLKELKDRDYIQVDLGEDNGATARKIYVSALVAAQYNTPLKNERPLDQKRAPTPLKNEHQNNIYINNIPPIAPQEGAASKHRRKPTQAVNMSPEMELQFSQFWDAYPAERRKAKQNARQRWVQLAPDAELRNTILDAIESLKQSDDWQRGIIPLPSTFLNNRRWEDAEELIQPETPEGRNYL